MMPVAPSSAAVPPATLAAFQGLPVFATIGEERPDQAEEREALLDAAFGPGRREKTSERLREGRLPAEGLALAATLGGRLVGTVRLWDVTLGPGRPGLMLGPLAVADAARSMGLGGRLMREALARAAAQGRSAVVLVGDAPYYARFGFSAEKMGRLWLPGPFERARFLGLELRQGALDGAFGLVSPTGRRQPRRSEEFWADFSAAA